MSSSDDLGMPAESQYTLKYDLCMNFLEFNFWDYECFMHATGLNIPFSVYYFYDMLPSEINEHVLYVCCECVCKSPISNNYIHNCCAAGA
jgi:hypothetical protein